MIDSKTTRHAVKQAAMNLKLSNDKFGNHISFFKKNTDKLLKVKNKQKYLTYFWNK